SAAASYFRRMGFWRRLFGGSSGDELKPQRLDYLNEALALERQGDYEAALTSYRLALRDHPNDARILQNMAIAFTKTRRLDEAIRHYRRALELDNGLAGAHDGLAFLLLRRDDPAGATQALRAVLAPPPRGPAAAAAPVGPAVRGPAVHEVVDGTTGPAAAAQPATGHRPARAGALRSNPLTTRVRAAADTVFPPGLVRDTVILSTPDSLSDSLGVLLQDTTANGAVNLTGRPIVFALTATYPSGAGRVTLVTRDAAYALGTP